jgi:hypothetical protein
MVQSQSEKTVETGGQHRQMPFLQMWHRWRVLEFLRLVQETVAPAQLKQMMKIR